MQQTSGNGKSFTAMPVCFAGSSKDWFVNMDGWGFFFNEQACAPPHKPCRTLVDQTMGRGWASSRARCGSGVVRGGSSRAMAPFGKPTPKAAGPQKQCFTEVLPSVADYFQKRSVLEVLSTPWQSLSSQDPFPHPPPPAIAVGTEVPPLAHLCLKGKWQPWTLNRETPSG